MVKFHANIWAPITALQALYERNTNMFKKMFIALSLIASSSLMSMDMTVESNTERLTTEETQERTMINPQDYVMLTESELEAFISSLNDEENAIVKNFFQKVLDGVGEAMQTEEAKSFLDVILSHNLQPATTLNVTLYRLKDSNNRLDNSDNVSNDNLFDTEIQSI